MNYKNTATEILKYVGTETNVSHLEHCSTRLRFSLNDASLIDEASLKGIEGVMGVVKSNQFQIIIGNDVVEVYDELIKMLKLNVNEKTATKRENQSFGKVALDFIIGIFQPLVPAIAGAGVLKSILLLLSAFGLVETTSVIYQILASISDATFYFLPMMIAVTTANKLHSNRLVAVAAVGVTLLPQVTALIAEGAILFGMTIQPIAYNAQVFPAILCVSLLAVLEKFLNKVSPKSLRIFLVPMIALAITIPCTLLFLGPLGYNVGKVFTTMILFLYGKFGFVALAILAAVLPMMIATGMHKTLIPYAISTYGELGYEMLYLPASLAHNISESGACFAVWLKAKNPQLKSTALSAGISAFMGITEPALYGVTLQNKKVLYSVMMSGFLVGGFLGLIGLKAFAIVGPGFPAMSMFIDVTNSMNIVWAIVGFIASIAISFILVLLFWKEEQQVEENTQINPNAIIEVVTPIKGEVIDLTKVEDEMFSKKSLGEGFAIIPDVGELVAPTNGVIQMIFDTKHAIGMTTENGADILFHVGIDTVRLEGKPFEVFVKVGDHVKVGDTLLKFNIDEIKNAGYNPVTPVVVTNSQDMVVTCKKVGTIDKNETVMTIRRKGV
ncbi:MAG: beta-glucoside-specific PTS transporter subunit IIABC [Anaerorhabdus sp.]|uniref:beta-glucoside-specific PTS transporter subunit IIABC n=1 Tax=Anaerorhabdus sp. TaxID=1872524 RepID=UPI003A8798DF